MWRAAFRSLLERKLRLSLTMVAIVLGVAFVAGTYIFTDSINKGFEEIFTKATAGFDVAVRTKSGVRGARPEPIPEEVVSEIRTVKGVRAVGGSVDDVAPILDEKGDPIGGQGPPTLAVSVSKPELSVFEIKTGRLPTGPTEVAIEAGTAQRHGFEVGEKVKALIRGAAFEFRVVGIVGVKGLEDLGGATMLAFELKSAQQLFDKKGTFDTIEVAGDPGISQMELRDEIDEALPDRYEVVARDTVVDEIVQEIRRAISFLTAALLPFGFIGLFVGAFLIFNTFSILFAQRVREFALLRAVGAKSSQILRTVMAEAILIGAVASVLGLGFGVLLVSGLRALFGGLGIDFPSSGTPILPRTVVISIVLGVSNTFLAALFPALRIRKISPVTALREGAVLATRKSTRRRYIGGGVVTGTGVALILFALIGGRNELIRGGQVLQIMGVGALLLFLGVALISPLLARPLARSIGWPIGRALGVPGKIARGNAMRDPSRTAATASALMIGVALVTFVTIFAASSKAAVAKSFEENLKADFLVRPIAISAFLSPEIAPRLEALPEVESTAGVRFAGLLLDGRLTGALGTDPNKIGQLRSFEVKEGKKEDLGDGILVKEHLAEERRWNVGSKVKATFPKGPAQELVVKGIYAGGPTVSRGGSEGTYSGDTLISVSTFEKGFVDQSDFTVYGAFASGVAPADGRKAVEDALKSFPNARFFDQAGSREQQIEQIDRLLALINGLLGLALVIALFGIVNTLALSIFERIREIGLLRAVGVTRRQVRSIVRWESVIVALIGAVLGIGVGVLFFYLLILQGGDTDLDFVLPGGRLLFYAFVAAVGGVLAAVLPARRAARIDVLRAIAYE